MASWTTPRTWVNLETVTPAMLNTHLRDNLQFLYDWFNNAWVGYTPTLTQSGAVTKTVTYAKYAQMAKLTHVNIKLDVTGTGTGSNIVTVSTPTTAASSGGGSLAVGAGWIYDSSATTTYKGPVYLATTGTFAFGATNGSLGTSEFTAALASGDSVNIHAVYETV